MDSKREEEKSIFDVIRGQLAEKVNLFDEEIRNKFWEPESLDKGIKPHQVPKPVEERDPESVQVMKRVLIILNSIERLTMLVNDLVNQKSVIPLVDYYNYARYGWKILPVIMEGLKKQIEELNKLASSTSDAGIPKIFSTIISDLEKINISDLKVTSLSNISNMSKGLPDFVDIYFSSRPAAPVLPETKGPALPQYTVPLKPSAQAMSEWFPLIEPTRAVGTGMEYVSGVLSRYIENQGREKGGKKFDEKAVKLFRDTFESLRTARLDKKGYYKLSEDTSALSRGFKSIFNLIKAINELPQGKGLTSYPGIISRGKKALDEFLKIDWSTLGPDVQELMDGFVDLVLQNSKNQWMPKLEKMAEVAHEAERKLCIVPGALIPENVRSFFDPLESFFLKRGIDFKNPLENTEKEVKKLEEKKSHHTAESIKKEKEISELMDRTSTLLRQYSELGEFGKARKHLGKLAAQVPNLSFIVGVSAVATYADPLSVLAMTLGVPLWKLNLVPSIAVTKSAEISSAILKGTVEKLVGSVESINREAFQHFPRKELLINLVEMRKKGLFSLEQLKEAEALEDHLISEMSASDLRELRAIFPAQIGSTVAELTARLKEIKDEISRLRESEVYIDEVTLVDLEADKKEVEDDIERRKVADAEGDFYKPLHKKLRAALEVAEKNASKWAIRRFVEGGYRAATKVIDKWPPEPVNKVTDVVIEMNKRKAKEITEYKSETKAITGYKKLDKGYAKRVLREEGISLLLAAKSGLHDRHANLAQKRKLMCVLADLLDKDRNEALNDAHKRCCALLGDDIIDPEKKEIQLKNTIEALIKSDDEEVRSLGHSLVVGTLLTGLVKSWDEKLVLSDSISQVRRVKMEVLDHLEADHILDIIARSESEKNRSWTILSLLQGSLSKEDKSTEDKLDKNKFVEVLSRRYKILEKKLESKLPNYHVKKEEREALKYKHEEKEEMNKIGLLLGRLAHADKEIAAICFNDKGIQGMLSLECLESKSTEKTRSDPTLYYEALVNGLPFSFIKEKESKNEKHESENRDHQKFVEENQKVIIQIHRIMNPDDVKVDGSIVDHYKNKKSAIDLAQLVERFIQTKVSPGSHAEMQLKAFYSALTLCSDNNEVRVMMLEKQMEDKGSIYSRYMRPLTEQASYPFWKLVQEDLVEPHRNRIIKEISDVLAAMGSTKAFGKDSPQYKKFMEGVNSFVGEKTKEINEIVNDLHNKALKLKENAHEYSGLCQFAKQEMDRVRGEVNQQHAVWQRWIRSEELVRSLNFELKEHKDPESFIDGNKEAIIGLYRGENPEEKGEEFIQFLKDEPFRLVQFLEKFARENVMPGSQPEAKLREFFSRLILCSESKELRNKIIEAEDSNLFKFMTEEADKEFSNLTKDNLIGDLSKEVLSHIGKVEKLGSRAKDRGISSEITKFVTRQQFAVESRVSELKSKPLNKEYLLLFQKLKEDLGKIKEESIRALNNWNEIIGQAEKNELNQKAEEINELLGLKLRDLGGLPDSKDEGINQLKRKLINLIESEKKYLSEIVYSLSPSDKDFTENLGRVSAAIEEKKKDVLGNVETGIARLKTAMENQSKKEAVEKKLDELEKYYDRQRSENVYLDRLELKQDVHLKTIENLNHVQGNIVNLKKDLASLSPLSEGFDRDIKMMEESISACKKNLDGTLTESQKENERLLAELKDNVEQTLGQLNDYIKKQSGFLRGLLDIFNWAARKDEIRLAREYKNTFQSIRTSLNTAKNSDYGSTFSGFSSAVSGLMEDRRIRRDKPLYSFLLSSAPKYGITTSMPVSIRGSTSFMMTELSGTAVDLQAVRQDTQVTVNEVPAPVQSVTSAKKSFWQKFWSALFGEATPKRAPSLPQSAKNPKGARPTDNSSVKNNEKEVKHRGQGNPNSPT